MPFRRIRFEDSLSPAAHDRMLGRDRPVYCWTARKTDFSSNAYTVAVAKKNAEPRSAL